MIRALLVVAVLPSAVLAQVNAIEAGSRVRAVIPAVSAQPITATFLSASADSVWLRDARWRSTTGVYRTRQLGVAQSQITGLEVSLGRNHRRGARNGLLTGLGGTVVFFGAGAAADSELSAVLAVGASMIFLPAAIIVGAVMGAESWRRVVPSPRP